MSRKPRLIIVAGPNGSGKTTITEQGLAHEWFDGCHYINPDLIAEHDFSGWNDPKSILQAAQKATELRYQLLEQKQSIAFETVFSTTEKLDFIRKAKENGYFIRVFFICTRSPVINASRIAQRVLEGGHEVPINKIISRYQKSILNAFEAAGLVDRFYLYDNSYDGEIPQLIARFASGDLAKRYMNSVPAWAQDFFDIEG
jgi:predicted ABC-type ATPase